MCLVEPLNTQCSWHGEMSLTWTSSNYYSYSCFSAWIIPAECVRNAQKCPSWIFQVIPLGYIHLVRTFHSMEFLNCSPTIPTGIKFLKSLHKSLGITKGRNISNKEYWNKEKKFMRFVKFSMCCVYTYSIVSMNETGANWYVSNYSVRPRCFFFCTQMQW